MKILLVGHGKMGRMVESLAGEYDCEVAGVIDPCRRRTAADRTTIAGAASTSRSTSPRPTP